MHKDDFSMRLTAAGYWAWRAMQKHVIDTLPPEFCYALWPGKESEKADVENLILKSLSDSDAPRY